MANTSTINPRPSQGSSFFAELETFLAEEDAERFDLVFSSHVVANGLHGTVAGLTGDPGNTTAFVQGFYVNETGTITYNDSTAHHWVIIYKDTTTILGGDWIRVSGTHYFFDPVSATQPTVPAGGLILMDVVTSGGSITSVTDLRNLTAFTVPEDVFKAKISSDDTTSGYLVDKIVAGTGMTITETGGGGNETLVIDSDGKARISTNDTTRDFIQDKLTAGDGLSETVVNAFGDETLEFDIALATISGLEFSSGLLRINTITNGGIALNANGAIVDITGSTETTTGLDTTNDEMLIEDASQTGEKKRKIKLSMLVPTGMVIPWIGTFAATPPSGWVHANGNSIGSADSSATERANEDTRALFILLWDNFANTEAATQDSSGTPVARGASATADFDNDRRIVIPDLRGRGVFGTGGTGLTTHGDTGGSETHALTTAELAAHTHGTNASTNAAGTSLTDNTGGLSVANGGSVTDSAGSGTAHENMPPWLALSWIIKL